MAAPQTQNVYVRLVANHQIELFADAGGLNPLTYESSQLVKGDGKGELRFNFILNKNWGHHWTGDPRTPKIETADLIIIPHTLDTKNEHGITIQRKKDSPFEPPGQLAHVLKDPAPNDDPGNLNGSLTPLADGDGNLFVPVPKTIKIKSVAGNQLVGPFKYTVVAIPDDGEGFDFVDPTIKIEP